MRWVTERRLTGHDGHDPVRDQPVDRPGVRERDDRVSGEHDDSIDGASDARFVGREDDDRWRAADDGSPLRIRHVDVI